MDSENPTFAAKGPAKMGCPALQWTSAAKAGSFLLHAAVWLKPYPDTNR